MNKTKNLCNSKEVRFIKIKVSSEVAHNTLKLSNIQVNNHKK